MWKTKILFLFMMVLASVDVYSEEYQIKMLSSLEGKMMVFEPPVLYIKAGDTVKWISKEPGHNSASIDEMLPKNAKSWNGAVNEEISVKFDVEGTYGYKCTPHYILGMVGLIIVGEKSSNFEQAKNSALSIEKKFATNKNRFTEYFAKVK
ncbi:MAG: pseudoazurin [Gammaproteobacteria bacterium]|nr:pseudoazurin [Gammaproteobacteria bacterium]